MDPTTVAIIGSAFIAVLTYWLNGYSNRNLERRRVNYSLKLTSFETVITHILRSEKVANAQVDLALRMFNKKAPLDVQDLTLLLDNTFSSDLPEELRSRQERLAAIRKRLSELRTKGQQVIPSEREAILTDLNSCMAEIRTNYMDILAEDNARVALVADTNEVITAFPAYCDACVETVFALGQTYDLRQSFDVLQLDADLGHWQLNMVKRFLDMETDKAALMFSAMKLELSTTMLSWPGKWLARKRYHKHHPTQTINDFKEKEIQLGHSKLVASTSKD